MQERIEKHCSGEFVGVFSHEHSCLSSGLPTSYLPWSSPHETGSKCSLSGISLEDFKAAVHVRRGPLCDSALQLSTRSRNTSGMSTKAVHFTELYNVF